MNQPVRIITGKDKTSFGGSQSWFGDKLLRNSGCGIVAGLDAVLRLAGIEELDKADYSEKLTGAAGFIVPITFKFFRKPFNVRGREFLGSIGVSAGRFKRGIRKLGENMGLKLRVQTIHGRRKAALDKAVAAAGEGLPVIMLIRAPLFNVTLTSSDGKRHETVGFHWVTITGSCSENGNGAAGDYIEVSSWGGKYLISRSDLQGKLVGTKLYIVSRL